MAAPIRTHKTKPSSTPRAHPSPAPRGFSLFTMLVTIVRFQGFDGPHPRTSTPGEPTRLAAPSRQRPPLRGDNPPPRPGTPPFGPRPRAPPITRPGNGVIRPQDGLTFRQAAEPPSGQVARPPRALATAARTLLDASRPRGPSRARTRDRTTTLLTTCGCSYGCSVERGSALQRRFPFCTTVLRSYRALHLKSGPCEVAISLDSYGPRMQQQITSHLPNHKRLSDFRLTHRPLVASAQFFPGCWGLSGLRHEGPLGGVPSAAQDA